MQENETRVAPLKAGADGQDLPQSGYKPPPSLLRKDEDICANCGKRPAWVNWVGEGGALAYVHGMSARWCERCAVEARLKYAEDRAAEIPTLRKALAALGG